MSKRSGMGFGWGAALLVLIGICVLGYLAVNALLDTSTPLTPEQAARKRQFEGESRAKWEARQAAQQADDEYGNRGMAIALAKNAVKDLLRAPSTAKFPSAFKIKDHRGEGEYVHTVVGWVFAQNSFGAIVRTDWVVQLEFTPPNDWKIIDVDFDED